MEDGNTGRSRLMLASSMLLFGTIGIFRRFIPLPSGFVALARAVIGMLFLLLLAAVRRKKPSWPAIRRNLPWLLLSGAFLGFNWILLFEAYRYSSVTVATLCYYMAPVFVILVSPLVLREKLSLKKILCAAIALAGMTLVSGLAEAGPLDPGGLRGIGFGLGAAALYAGVILSNKRMSGIGGGDRTLVELAVAALALLPYVCLAERFSGEALSAQVLLLLAIVGVVHTGLAYALYFGSMEALSAGTLALFGYIDPVVAILASALILGERLSLWGMVGAVLVLGAALWSELPPRGRRSV